MRVSVLLTGVFDVLFCLFTALILMGLLYMGVFTGVIAWAIPFMLVLFILIYYMYLMQKGV